jgi:acetylornithine deacetylase/succinyl-diaminopimelate desuccinylase-like protein
LQAHRPDEYIETDQLSQCWHFISNIISHLQRSPLPTD